ncbi:MAG: membrane protein insertase YidC [Deferrisomatales bacterium]
MELKRTILAVALSMAVLLVFQHYLAPKPRVPAQGSEVSGVSREAPGTPAEAGPPEGAPGAAQPPLAAPTPTAVPVTRDTIENDHVVVEISSRGAAVVGALVKTYTDRAGPDGSPVRLLDAPSGIDRVGEVRLTSIPEAPAALFERIEHGPDRAVYAWTSPTGIRIEKHYRLSPGRYDATLTVRIVNGAGQPFRDRAALVMVEDFSGKQDRFSRYNFSGPVYFADGKYEEVKLKKLAEGVQVSSVEWAALLHHYFLVAAVPEGQTGAAFDARAFGGQEKAAMVSLVSPVFDLAPGQDVQLTYRVYLGPKLESALAQVGSDLDKLVNYGFFHVIAKPLLAFLNAIYRVTGNYGIAIIVLTTLIKAIFWPLSAKSFKSMQRMKEIQPKLQKLRERYGNDRERLNMEVMQLYKTHKVNPLGGCLPMIVQIPFFFALYRILLGSIELRQAPFMLWITDLSAKDPYYVTPLLMGATMFLQQRLTPASAGNEAQMKMMMYGMPIVFTVLFLNFPAGLVLYWLVNNVLSVAQQAMTLKRAKPA